MRPEALRALLRELTATPGRTRLFLDDRNLCVRGRHGTEGTCGSRTRPRRSGRCWGHPGQWHVEVLHVFAGDPARCLDRNATASLLGHARQIASRTVRGPLDGTGPAADGEDRDRRAGEDLFTLLAS